MSLIGIVCEFNPFHNGHKYLIDSVKKDGDIVVCVMSGNFVQRGEPAIFPKDVRTRTALMNGADIVIELPFAYATASAEYFATNALRILDSVGCDKIAFGTENNNIEDIERVARNFEDDNFKARVSHYLDKGLSYPTARQSAFDELELDFDISAPNSILAIEYIKAIKMLSLNIKPVTVKRTGTGYHDEFSVDSYASATYIRNCIFNNRDFKELVPRIAFDEYDNAIKNGRILSQDKYDISSVTLLRSNIYEKNDSLSNMSEGLCNRIDSAVKESISLDEIYERSKTKRYTYSRIKRGVLSRMFSVSEKTVDTPVPYCRLLGYNKSVQSKIGDVIKNSKLPFVVRYSDIEKGSDFMKEIFMLECKTTDFYNSVLVSSQSCSKEMTFFPEKI